MSSVSTHMAQCFMSQSDGSIFTDCSLVINYHFRG